MKKSYSKPSMQVIELKQRPELLFTSGGQVPQSNNMKSWNDTFA